MFQRMRWCLIMEYCGSRSFFTHQVIYFFWQWFSDWPVTWLSQPRVLNLLICVLIVRLYDEEPEHRRLLPQKHDIITLLGVGGHWITSEDNLQVGWSRGKDTAVQSTNGVGPAQVLWSRTHSLDLDFSYKAYKVVCWFAFHDALKVNLT